MNKQAIVISLILLGTAVQVHAQAAMPNTEFPVFVGVHAFNGAYEVFFPRTPNLSGTGLSWQLTAGVNLSPRFALQLGGTYSRTKFDDDPSYIGTTTTGQSTQGSYHSKRWTHCVPLLARYAVVRSPRPRLQVEALFGASVVATRDVFWGDNRINGQVVSEFYEENKATHVYATGGLGFRYPFGRRFEGVFDWTYSRNLRAVPEAVHQGVTGNKWGLTRALSLGLRYRFAVKKKAVAADS